LRNSRTRLPNFINISELESIANFSMHKANYSLYFRPHTKVSISN